MPTISELKALNNSQIRTKVTANSISPDNVADRLDAALDKVGEALSIHQILADSETIGWNFTNGNLATVTLGGNRTLSITNLLPNTFGLLKVIQDATGGRTLTVAGNKPADFALSSGAGEVDILGFYYDGSSLFWSIENYGEAVGEADLFLTWESIGSEMESYNSSKGIRKKSTGTASWVSPSAAANSALAVETLSPGETVIVKCGEDPVLATTLILSSVNNPNQGEPSDVDYGWYTGVSLAAFAQPQETAGSLQGSPFTITGGELLRIFYGANMIFSSSTDGGTTWTTRHTSGTTPSGTYYIVVQSFSVLAGFDEIYKL